MGAYSLSCHFRLGLAACRRAGESSGDLGVPPVEEVTSEASKEEALQLIDRHFFALSAPGSGLEAVGKDLLPDMVRHFSFLGGHIHRNAFLQKPRGGGGGGTSMLFIWHKLFAARIADLNFWFGSSTSIL